MPGCTKDFPSAALKSAIMAGVVNVSRLTKSTNSLLLRIHTCIHYFGRSTHGNNIFGFAKIKYGDTVWSPKMEFEDYSSRSRISHGKMQNKQRKGCELNFVQGDSRRGKNRDKQRRALRSYLENMRLRAMGGVLGVSTITVLN
jgi:hypothetical protein